MTRVINIIKSIEPHIYIGRPSIWGNPYKLFDESQRLRVIELYRSYVLANDTLMFALKDLKDQTLGCYCKPKPCHGDVLVELINRFYPDKPGEKEVSRIIL